MNFVRPALLFALCTSLVGCPPPPDPYYDEDIGIEGVPVDPGAMAGTFATKMQITTQTDLPLIGTVTGGGDTYLLIERTWDEATGSYSQVHQVCGGRIRSETSTSVLADESWRAVPAEPPSSLELRDEDGYFALTGHLELWGLLRAAFDDPYTDALPADHIQALEEPHASRIVDMDEDGHPGMTIYVEGLVTGDYYFVQRKLSDMHGVVLGPDRIVGLNETSFEQVILGAAEGPVQQGFPQRQHPDPMQSWIDEIRLEDGSGCDEVLAAVDDERLARFDPF